MNNKYQNILNNSSACLTAETMQKYIAENLSDSDKRNVEMHLADCEMCSDELEGLSLLKKPKDLAFIIEELNEKIDFKSQAKPKLIFLQRLKPYYSAAALVLVLISLSIFLVFNDFSNSNTEMADNMVEEKVSFSEEPSPETEKLSDEKSISVDTFISSLDKNTKLLAENSSAKKRKKKLQIISEVLEIYDDMEAEIDFDEYLSEETTSLVASENPNYISEKSEFSNKISPEILSEELDEELGNESDDELAVEMPLENEKGDYSVAVSGVKKEISRAKSSKSRDIVQTDGFIDMEEIIFQFKNKNYQITINSIDSLKLEISSKDYYKSLWYKSLSYIELGNYEAAKILLKELSENKNTYQSKAKRKLRNTEN